MDLRHLRYFLALAECLDVAAASKRCGLTPSVLGRRISDLEESMGCSLFRRKGSKVTLSAAGQVFLVRARELLATVSDAMGEAKATAEAAAHVIRLGHYGAWWNRRYAGKMKRFRERAPGVRIEATEYSPADLASNLREGEIDAAFLEHVDVALRIDFNIKRIEALPTVVLMKSDHELAKRKRVALEDLGEAAWIVWEERVFPGRRRLLLDAAKECRIMPCIASDAESEHAVFEQVISSGALGYAPDIFDSVPPGLVMVNLRPSAIEFPVFLAWRRDADNVAQLDSLAECLLR